MKRLFKILAVTVVLLCMSSQQSMAQTVRACAYCVYIVQAGMYGENTLYFLHQEVRFTTSEQKSEILSQLRTVASNLTEEFSNRGRSDDGSFVKTSVEYGIHIIRCNQSYDNWIFDVDKLIEDRGEKMLPRSFYGDFKFIAKRSL